MYRVIKIGNKDVEMVANGATPYRYKQIFHKDYFRYTTSNNRDGADDMDMMAHMAYVMAMQAAKADMSKLNEETFIEWMGEFDVMDVVNAAAEIMVMINGNAAGTSTPKAEAAQ